MAPPQGTLPRARQPQPERGQPGVPDAAYREMLVHTRDLLHDAVKTILALPDRERRFQSGPKSSMPQPAPDPNVSYDNDAAKAAIARAGRFRPSQDDLNRYEEVMGWIAWLKRQHHIGKPGDNWGRTAAQLIIYRATGNSWWKIAQRLKLGRSDDTARRWHDFAVETIALAFAARIAEMD